MRKVFFALFCRKILIYALFFCPEILATLKSALRKVNIISASVMLGEVGWMWCRMFKSLQLYYTAWHGLFCLHCCCCRSALCFKTVNPGCLFFLTVLATSLGPSPESSTQRQQTFPCCTVCLVWLALGAREVPHALGVPGESCRDSLVFLTAARTFSGPGDICRDSLTLWTAAGTLGGPGDSWKGIFVS